MLVIREEGAVVYVNNNDDDDPVLKQVEQFWVKATVRDPDFVYERAHLAMPL